ncbi:flavodoxin family protein [Patescibacteria group bacterium]
MKILAISGSHRKGGNTKILLNEVLKECKKAGAEVELVELAGIDIKYCQGHDSSFCREKGCIYNDEGGEVLEKMEKADTIIIGSPVYLGTVTSKLKALIDRSVILRRKGFKLEYKIGAAVAVGGYHGGGQEITLLTINNFFGIHNMTIVPDGKDKSHFGVAAVGGEVGDVKSDKHGMQLARNIGKRIIEELRLRK